MQVYLDNAATTPVCTEAARAAMEAMTGFCPNPSSTHAPGRAAKAAVEAARGQVARAMGALPEEIFFVSCGTEADHWALTGGVQARRNVGKHVITSAVEHDAVLETARRLEEQGYEITRLSPEKDGSISPDAVMASLREDTALVSLMLVNNETGAVTDIGEIAKRIHAAGSRALVHTDAVQGFLKLDFTPAKLGADLLSVSGHKIHAPKGIGALYIKKGLHLRPGLPGGGQEKGLRSGTEPVPNICAFGAAAELGKREFEVGRKQIHETRERTAALLRELVPQTEFICETGAEDILSLSLPGYRSEVLLNCLDADGVYVSRSSACKRGGRSHVLEAMGVPAKVIDGTIRVSFSRYNTPEEGEYFVRCLEKAAGRLRHR